MFQKFPRRLSGVSVSPFNPVSQSACCVLSLTWSLSAESSPDRLNTPVTCFCLGEQTSLCSSTPVVPWVWMREVRLVTARSCLVFPRLLCSGRTPLVCGSIQTSQLPSCQSACRLVSTLQRFSRKRRLLWRRESPSQSSEEQQVVLLNKKSQFRSIEFH